MMKPVTYSFGSVRRCAGFITGLALLMTASGAGAADNPSTQLGVNDPAARFRGAPTYDFSVTNVKWEAATPEYSFVTFDLSWSYSWRAKWVEPAATSATGKDMELENWDAAWVFVKFLAEKDSKDSIERNHWRHAALDPDPSHHVMPAGVTNAVGLAAEGTRGLGVFIHRDRIGHGVNEWKGIKLRWVHGTDPSTALGAGKLDAAKAAVRVFALPMVYVPRGAFKVGSGSKTAFTKFADGPTLPLTRSDPNPDDEGGSLCDGSWRGGPVIPFLVDEEWNGPSADGSRARRVGRTAGQLWSTLTYPEVGGDLSNLGAPGALNDAYPTGYEPFYCMKYNLTQGQYVDFLNSLPPDVAAGRAFLSSEFGVDYPIGMNEYKLDVGPEYQPLTISERGGLTITLSRESLTNGCGALPTPPGLQRKAPDAGAVTDDFAGDLTDDPTDDLLKEMDKQEQAEGKRRTGNVPPVYAARLPFRTSCGFSLDDTRAYAVWAGLRPMTELELEKAGRGSRNPVPYEGMWGSTDGVRADTGKDLEDAGLPTERCRKGNHGGGYGAFLCVIRAGCFATPTSDRVAAGASYWGILELGGDVVPLLHRRYLGTHGDGSAPTGKPGGSLERNLAPFLGPEDWPEVLGGRGITDRAWVNKVYIGGRFGSRTCRLVASAPGTTRVPAKASAQKPAAPAAVPVAAPSPDAVTVSNVKLEAGGKEFSTISFDLSWKNSWRANWTESAAANVTGKALSVESWDAAWVFVKFLSKGSEAGGGAQTLWQHATLDTQSASHQVPAGAALDVGLTDDGLGGAGVFVYRAKAGQGPVDFKGITLRLASTPLPDSSVADPAPKDRRPAAAGLNTEISVQAIGMVYVPAGAFRSKTPWKDTFATIRNPDATAPDGCRVATNAPTQASWPNGVNAFYSMKHGINQGLYAAYLNFGAVDPAKAHADYKPSAANYGFGRQTVRFDEAQDMFVAEQPDLPRSYLCWAEILAVTSWAGLRPITDLEYEKACRGPREVARAEDAWADGICAPAAGLAPETVMPLPGLDCGASYWGIRGLGISGCMQEWPGTVSDDQYGLTFDGSHGTGRPEAPANWPKVCAFGQHYGFKEFLRAGVWVLPTDFDNLPNWEPFTFDRTGRFGARAVRTAPFRPDENSPLQLDALPNLTGCDIAVAYLSGRYRNDGDTPLNVELVALLPADAYLQGAASRAFTAAPKAVTSFKIPVALTAASAKAAVLQGKDMFLPLKIQGPGGEVLAEGAVRLQMEPSARPPAIVQSLEGGKIELKVKNAMADQVKVAFSISPLPVVRVGETNQSLTVAAGGEGAVAFPVPRQRFAQEGPCRIPYSVAVGGGVAMAGETSVELRTQTRWWLTRRVNTGPKFGDGDDALGLLDGAFSEVGDVFTLDAPSKGWEPVTCGAAVRLGQAGSLPSLNSKAIGATRAIAVADADAVVVVRAISAEGSDLSMNRPEKGEVGFFIRAWVNEKLAFDSRAPEKERAKSVRILKGANAVVVEWLSNVDGESAAQGILMQFNDAASGKPLPEMFFDMEKK